MSSGQVGKSVRRYFDGWAPRYDRDLRRYAYCVPEEVRAMAAAQPVAESAPLRILDLGVGTGLCCAPLRRAFPAAIIAGMDLSPRMLRLCRAAGVADLLCRGDAASGVLPFAPCSFDMVVGAGLLEYCRDAESVIAGAAAVLRPGGILILVFETPDTIGLYPPGLFTGIVETAPGLAGIKRFRGVFPFHTVYMKYLHEASHVAALCRRHGMEERARKTFNAYRWPRRGGADQIVTHDILAFENRKD